MGQHEPGKHTKGGQKKQAAQPRMPKGRKGQAANTSTSGTVHGKGTGGWISKIFRKK